jgi:uncharacterized SAM-binding protein YcdF (DUF218 family)
MDTIVVLKFLGRAALPPASMVLGLVLALILGLLGFRKVARAVAALAVLETALLSLPVVADILMAPLERESRKLGAAAPACCYEAIVVLGGGVRPAIPPWQPDPDLGSAADRVWMAARLYHRGIAPTVIVSGGSLLARYGGVPSSPEAVAMAQFLSDLGVPSSAIVSEAQAINTADNIRQVRALVQDKPVALVTSAYHMPRAMRLAARGGLNASAFPTDWQPPWSARPYWDNWLPTDEAEGTSATALWEYLALAFDYRSVGTTR